MRKTHSALVCLYVKKNNLHISVVIRVMFIAVTDFIVMIITTIVKEILRITQQ